MHPEACGIPHAVIVLCARFLHIPVLLLCVATVSVPLQHWACKTSFPKQITDCTAMCSLCWLVYYFTSPSLAWTLSNAWLMPGCWADNRQCWLNGKLEIQTVPSHRPPAAQRKAISTSSLNSQFPSPTLLWSHYDLPDACPENWPLLVLLPCFMLNN